MPSKLQRIGTSRQGWATYYCCTKGYRGEAVVALPGWHYVPKDRQIRRWARVCVTDENVFKDGNQKGACGIFAAVDYCGCGKRRGERTIVDLSLAARDDLNLVPGYGFYGVRVTILVER